MVFVSGRVGLEFFMGEGRIRVWRRIFFFERKELFIERYRGVMFYFFVVVVFYYFRVVKDKKG